ncbi:MAG TPA: ATP-binding protein [Sphaerochaeta sp.]|nr:ATP-binding protein [Sphaerochaeta sp.]
MHISLADYLLDIVQNSFEAESPTVTVTIDQSEKELFCSVVDSGKGMDELTQKRVLDPFFSEEGKHASRRVGLGLPFLHQAVEATEGAFALESTVGVGTTISFSFMLEHIDSPPLGDLALAFSTLLAHPLAKELSIHRRWEVKEKQGGYTLDRSELLEVLGELESSGNLLLLRQFVASHEGELPQELER